MATQKFSASIQKLITIASLIGASAIAAGFVASPASAISLVPQKEGEVNVGFDASLDSSGYLTLDPLIKSVESLVDSSTSTKSRLFVDEAGTENKYGKLKFLKFDVGTAAPSPFWFRPVAMMEDGITPLVEKGQLEVGTFKFNFAKTIDSLTVSWFDTEYKGDGTSYKVNDTEVGVVPPGSHGNVYTETFTNVDSLLLNLGEAGSGILANGKKANWTGDGVLVTAEATESVPEPATVSALIGVGALGLMARRRKNAIG